MAQLRVSRRRVLCGLVALSGAELLPKLIQAQPAGGGPPIDVSPESKFAPGLQISTESALSDLSATTFEFHQNTVNGIAAFSPWLAGQQEIPAGVTTGDLVLGSTEPTGSRSSTITRDERRSSSGFDDGDVRSVRDTKTESNIAEVYEDFMSYTAAGLSFHESTEINGSPIVDTAGHILGVYNAIHENNDTDPNAAAVAIGTSIFYDFASGAAATAAGEATFGFFVATAPVSAPVAAVAGVSAVAVTTMTSHIVGTYLEGITKSVLGNLAGSFSQEQARIEGALYEYVNSPFAAGQ